MTLAQAERRAKRLSIERRGVWAAVLVDFEEDRTYDVVPYSHVNSCEFEAFNGEIKSVFSYGEEI